jgi:hypothetical protein
VAEEFMAQFCGGSGRLSQAKSTPTAGLALFASARCVAGDVVLSVPISACITAVDLPTHLQGVGAIDSEGGVRVEGGDDDAAADSDDNDDNDDGLYGQTQLALLHLLQTKPADPRVVYFTTLCPLDGFDEMHLEMWDADSAAARHSKHTVAWRRARASKANIERERLLVAKTTGIVVGPKRFLWAALVMRTRALKWRGGVGLVPGFDIANHTSHSTDVRVTVHDGCVQLLSLYTMKPGDEIKHTYVQVL